jgi:putative ABC transport system ATP-binding protein
VDDHAQTVVMVTHDPVAAAYTDRVVFLSDGRIVDELLQPDREQVIAWMAAAEPADPEPAEA